MSLKDSRLVVQVDLRGHMHVSPRSLATATGNKRSLDHEGQHRDNLELLRGGKTESCTQESCPKPLGNAYMSFEQWEKINIHEIQEDHLSEI
ncbi:hypothetical protein E2C01_076801 [Portunus trituberculatus]|uniref:Uncharacterized protein n=1 Tax=Portunus trituberculatus TaxID=210409 RepID=A0A5B7IPM6_PORTR|nr:hypothetical protein [Portunus trituberculatus]